MSNRERLSDTFKKVMAQEDGQNKQKPVEQHKPRTWLAQKPKEGQSQPQSQKPKPKAKPVQNPKVEPAESYKAPKKYNKETNIEIYKRAVAKVFPDEKNKTNVQILMDACVKEDEMAHERVLNTLLNSSVIVQPYRFARGLNDVLNTTYTDDDFEYVLKPFAEQARTAIRDYVMKTLNSKKRKTAAQEMREEMNLCNLEEGIKKLKENKKQEDIKEQQPEVQENVEETKPTFWQKVKAFFSKK